jgi:hypothetical protein
VHREIRPREVDLEPEPDPHRLPDHARQLDRAQRKALVTPTSTDREGPAGTAPQQRDGGVRAGRGVAFAADGGLHHAHSRECQTAFDQLVLGRLAGEQQDPSAVAHVDGAQVGCETAQIALERGNEQRPVPPLEGELAELEQNAPVAAQILHLRGETSAATRLRTGTRGPAPPHGPRTAAPRCSRPCSRRATRA